MLCLNDTPQLLQNEYLDIETGHGPTSDNMYHVAASTYMPNCTAEMVDWWFGFILIIDMVVLHVNFNQSSLSLKTLRDFSIEVDFKVEP